VRRVVSVLLLPLALTGCASRRMVDATPEWTTASSQASQAAAQPARPPAMTVESSDLRLAAVLTDVSRLHTPQAYRDVAAEYRRVGIVDEAHDYLERALLLDPGDAATYDARARLWRDAGFPHLALGDAYRAIGYAPRSPIAHNTLGTILQALGHHGAARAQYERALRLDPSAVYALNNQCYAWIVEGRPSRAIAACARALQLDPGLRAARNNLALAHAAAGNVAAARAIFQTSADRAAGLYNVGIVDLARGDYASAVTAFAAAHVSRPTLSAAAARARQAAQLARVPRGE
jgi:tetratricopeptide (TPR) repeat protein